MTPGTRIVSLVPSITELLFDLGLGGQVVGRTTFCIHPRDRVATIPRVGGTKDVDLDRLRALEPTHVIVNVDENTASVADTLRDFVPHVIVTHPIAPADNLSLFRLLGGVFGCERRAEDLCGQLQRALDACHATAWPRETVLYVVWKGPWMTVAPNTYIAGTLHLVGWQVVTRAAGWAGRDRYPAIDDLDAAVAGVERVLLSSEPYAFRETHASELRARFPATPVDLVDGEMVGWYGSRALLGVPYLRHLRQTMLTSA